MFARACSQLRLSEATVNKHPTEPTLCHAVYILCFGEGMRMRLLFTFASEHNAEVQSRVPVREGWDAPDGENINTCVR